MNANRAAGSSAAVTTDQLKESSRDMIKNTCHLVMTGESAYL